MSIVLMKDLQHQFTYLIVAMFICILTTNGFNLVKYKSSTQNSFKRSVSMISSSVKLDKQSICIIGGGFGGIYTAVEIDKLLKKHDSPDVNIYVFDSKDKFVFLPLLYELAFGYAAVTEVSPKYDQLLAGTNIKFIQSNVIDVDPDSRTVTYSEIEPTTSEHINDAKTMQYDQCVLAMGTQPRVTMIPGAEAHAIPFSRVTDVYELQTKLRGLIEDGSYDTEIKVNVIGAGYSGVEVAANAAEYIKKMNRIPVVNIIDRNSEIMHTPPPFNQASAKKVLQSLGVNIYLNASASQVDEKSITLEVNESGRASVVTLSTDLTILTTGVQQSPLTSSIHQLKKDKFGRILTSTTLQCLGYPNLFALGDCSTIQVYAGREETTLPKTAQVAMQQSGDVAKNLYQRTLLYGTQKHGHFAPILSNDDPSTTAAAALPKDIHTKRSFPDELNSFRFIPLGEMLSLGETNAALTSLGGLVKVDGAAASAARRLVYALRMPTNRQKANAAFNAGVVTAASLLTKFMKTAVK